MTLLKLDGSQADTTLKAEEKDHHPERVLRRRQQLEKTFSDLQEGWMQDNSVAPGGSSVPNEPAIDRHYDARWRETCRVADNANEAVTTQPERMQEWITEQRAKKVREEQWTTPLHKIPSLDEFSFRLVGIANGSNVWLNSHFALQVEENGRVRVWITVGDDSFAHLLPLLQEPEPGWHFHPLVDAIDYTPKELMTLMGAMRLDKVTHPTEHELEQARASMGEEPGFPSAQES